MSPRQTLLRRCLAASLPLLLALPAAAQDGPASFREDFDRINGKRWFISDGWTNGPHQNCDWSQKAVRADDGILKLMYFTDPRARARTAVRRSRRRSATCMARSKPACAPITGLRG